MVTALQHMYGDDTPLLCSTRADSGDTIVTGFGELSLKRMRQTIDRSDVTNVEVHIKFADAGPVVILREQPAYVVYDSDSECEDSARAKPDPQAGASESERSAMQKLLRAASPDKTVRRVSRVLKYFPNRVSTEYIPTRSKLYVRIALPAGTLVPLYTLINISNLSKVTKIVMDGKCRVCVAIDIRTKQRI